jgi:exodeoxyribonuclease VII small subunit
MAVKKLKTKISRLETIAETLEKDTQEIEGSLKLFEEGMRLIKDCNHDLDSMEGRVMVMINGEEEAFDGSSK